ncbi:MAG TPA: hypothetical protein VJ963_03585 [Bacteroidales bacterium]|nr:hypothetical protein [Bacteroidales bacterium]
MKRKTITLFVILLMAVCAVNAQDKAKKQSPAGTWKFDAPYAPEGYTNGLITVVFENSKPKTTMSFAGYDDYKIPGENVKATGDSLMFSVYVENQDVKVLLKMEDEAKMTGKAIYFEGEIPLTLTRDASKD